MNGPKTAIHEPVARRTQAERSAATKSALLDAAIEALIEEGYAGTTTRGVAARAGVTPGALQHHFASRAVLVTEALRALAERLTAQILEPAVAGAGSDRDRWEALIDRLWEVHCGPLFQAFLELWVAARTDNEPRDGLAAVADDLGLQVFQGALYAFPGLVGRPGFGEAVITGLATLRGLAMLGFLPGANPDVLWPATRQHLIDLFEQASGEPSPEASR